MVFSFKYLPGQASESVLLPVQFPPFISFLVLVLDLVLIPSREHSEYCDQLLQTQSTKINIYMVLTFRGKDLILKIYTELCD